MDFTLPSYRWRGKDYKTISPLMRAVSKKMDCFAIGFEADAMVVTPARGATPIRFARRIEGSLSIIADDPS